MLSKMYCTAYNNAFLAGKALFFCAIWALQMLYFFAILTLFAFVYVFILVI